MQKHPRVSGEYYSENQGEDKKKETPPRERGIRSGPVLLLAEPGNTPA